MKIIEKKSDRKENGSFLLRFVTSYSILLIFVLVMGLFLYQYGIKDAKNNLHNQNKLTLSKSANSLEHSLTAMTTLVSQLNNNTAMRTLVKIDNSNHRDFQQNALEVKKLLSDFYAMKASLPLFEYYIYLPNVDYVLSSNTLSDVHLFYKYYKSMEDTQYHDWFTMIQSKNNLFHLISLKDYYKGSFQSFLYKVPISTSYLTNQASATVCFEISKSDLNEIFSSINLMETGFLLVTDENDKEIFCINGEKTDVLTKEALLTEVQTKSLDLAGNHSVVKLNQEKMVITSINSSNNLWSYYLVQPSNLVFSDLNAYQNAYGIIILMTCLFCLILIYILSRYNVKPYIKMTTELASSMQENDSLQLKLKNQRPMIYNSYMNRILKGLISTEEEELEIKNFLGLSCKETKYSILSVNVYENQMELYAEESIGGLEEEDAIKDYRELIHSYFYQFFGEDVLIYDVAMNSFAILMPTDATMSPEVASTIVKDRFISLHDHLMKEHSIWIFGGLGNRNSALSYLWKSYQQANQAVSYIHDGNVFQSYHEIKRDKSSYYYPVEMAQQLTNFIHTGNEKQVHEIFKILRKSNFEDVSLPMTLIKWLLSDIRNTLAKVRFSVSSSNDNQLILEEIDSAFHENKTLELMEEISVKLCSLHEQKVEGNRLILNIQAYIRENYMDSSLSLKKISEVFNISESYFSYLFKAETKQNFSEYLEQIRMDQAMILLKTTDINVGDMFLELGYNNANSFRRAFKKIHGVSPKTIRETNQTFTNLDINNT